ncbi:ribonuclease H2, subunit C [Neurospora hispaniola]|uniref:Ribonuclease H2, subunit C n=1 Tax=Neurospora hispaniola TaxID=588809 RepID=A0AAJ0MM64_9PEZI|nr:ribonuclease H2, subunit C [Neurospora hispaniola]
MTQQPILAFTSSSNSPPKTTPNLLPCRIHHSGSVEPTDSFWSPHHEQDGNLKIAYFRGRKLHGKTLPLPEGYKGVVASKVSPKQQTTNQKPRLAHEMSFVMENDEPEVIDLDSEAGSGGQEPEVQVQVGGAMEVQAEFEEVVVWGHEHLADAGGDAYVRGVEEWVGFAERVHSF